MQRNKSLSRHCQGHVIFWLLADDTSPFSAVDDTLKSPSKLTNNLITIQDWAYKWKMTFNPDTAKPAHKVTLYRKARSSFPEVFCRKSVLRNFAKFTGKHLSESLFLRPATLLKKRLWHRCFPVNFAKFQRTPFFTEHLRWLLLKS